MEAKMCFASTKDTLYKIVLGTIAGSQAAYNHCRDGISTLDKKLQFDIYHELFVQRKLCELFMELSQFKVFSRLLGMSGEKIRLHSMFQGLMDYKPEIIKKLMNEFCEHMAHGQLQEPDKVNECLRIGCNLSEFFSEAGWYAYSEEVYQACFDAVSHDEDDDGDDAITEDESKVNLFENERKVSLPEKKRKDKMFNAFDYCLRLLQVQQKNCRYEAANKTCQKAFSLMKHLSEKGCSVNCALLYAEQCLLLQAQNHWNEAFEVCFKALQELKRSLSSLSVETVIDVLRTCSMTYSLKGELNKAEVLIQQAVYIAKKSFMHPKYADVLLVYGSFLLKIGVHNAAVLVYQEALSIYIKMFGGHNFKVALVHLHLAEVAFLLENMNDKSIDAREHTKISVDIVYKILPQDHAIMYWVKRIQAFVKELMAYKTQDRVEKEKLLSEAHMLHCQSGRIVEKTYGEKSMKMAQHYNIMGSFYWSKCQFKQSENMILKGIEIEESQLGSDNYLVADSKRSLASFYNDGIGMYKEAEDLYLHSINITKSVFGEAYIRLGYDYDDLRRLYVKMGNHEQAQHYSTVLQSWKDLRAQRDATWANPLDIEVKDSLENIISKDF